MGAVKIQAAPVRTPVSDTEVEIFYLMHRQRLQSVETRLLRHILITLNEDIAENRRAVAQARLSALRESLLDSPQDFAQAALQHSECPTALNGGLLGTVPRGKLYPELEPVAFALQPDELSAIAESPMGLHLLRCDAITPARQLSLAEASAAIRSHLERARQR